MPRAMGHAPLAQQLESASSSVPVRLCSIPHPCLPHASSLVPASLRCASSCAGVAAKCYCCATVLTAATTGH